MYSHFSIVEVYHADDVKNQNINPISLNVVIILQKISAKKKSLNLTGPKGAMKI